jgi:hypothetical protein
MQYLSCDRDQRERRYHGMAHMRDELEISSQAGSKLARQILGLVAVELTTEKEHGKVRITSTSRAKDCPPAPIALCHTFRHLAGGLIF